MMASALSSSTPIHHFHPSQANDNQASAIIIVNRHSAHYWTSLILVNHHEPPSTHLSCPSSFCSLRRFLLALPHILCRSSTGVRRCRPSFVDLSRAMNDGAGGTKTRLSSKMRWRRAGNQQEWLTIKTIHITSDNKWLLVITTDDYWRL